MVNLQGRGENASEELKTLDAKVVGGSSRWEKMKKDKWEDAKDNFPMKFGIVQFCIQGGRIISFCS